MVAQISKRLDRSLHFWMTPSEYVDGYEVDRTDPEWALYTLSLPPGLAVLFAHLVAFCIVPKVLLKRISQYVMIAFWFAAQLYLTSMSCMLVMIAFCTLVVAASLVTQSELVAWGTCLAFILKAHNVAPFSSEPAVYYLEFNTYLYGAIKVINFCIHLTRNQKHSLTSYDLMRFVQYMLYPPYMSLLIVVYEDFAQQMDRVEQQTEAGQDEGWKGWIPVHLTRERIWKLVRLVFWLFAFEAMLHFIHVHSFFNGPFSPFNEFNNYELATTAYVNGQLFFWKYVVIFGLPIWFATIDGMVPPREPICIYRVSRYSRMWRYFDNGLYNFLKTQVYMPLIGEMKGNHLMMRRLLAMVGAFVFVLVWHGTETNNIYWVLLSGTELIIERIGYAIACTSSWQQLSTTIGRRNQRRLIACGMIGTVIPGIFGVFFFLGRGGFGELVFKKVLVNGFAEAFQLRFSIDNGMPSASLVMVHLVLLGYCFNNVCLELDESIKKEEQPIDAQEQKEPVEKKNE